MIGRKALSPVELFDACVARIERTDPAVNAVVARDFERGREQAKRAEAAQMAGGPLGLLHGLPVAVKDLTATEGLATTWGSLVYKDHRPDRDELLVRRIKAAGGIVIGKTNTPEFGAGANTVNRVYGATVNPFDPRLSCAGSSGGSAAALAAGMVPLATGSDMGGSLRTPAAFCGVVGHRPSPGTVPSDARRYGWSPLSVDGPMARDVRDAALLLAALAGPDAADPLSLELDPGRFAALSDRDLGSLRVAFSADLGSATVSKTIRDHFAVVAERLEPLFGRAEWRDPDLGDVHRTFDALRAANFAHAYGDYIHRHRDRAGPNVIRNTEFAHALSVADIGRAHAEQTALFRRFQSFFEDFDLLICPAAAVEPFPVEDVFVAEIDGRRLSSYIEWISVTYAVTLTTHPATVVPCGLSPAGLPFGIQIVGRRHDDFGTLAAAAAIEAALAGDPEYCRPIPDLHRLLSRQDGLAGRIPAALEAHVAKAEG
ncbi:amidase [Faunimonas sp. B44]|uniref:amidase n=1 Tax=Faunimonas sp. B44 TaxID=3461493 RepID=UPI0040445489